TPSATASGRFAEGRLSVQTLLPARSRLVLLVVLGAGVAPAVWGADAATGPDRKDLQAVVTKGVAFLKSRQGPDSSYSPKIAGPGVSALVAAAFLRSGLGPDDPAVARTLAYLEKKVQPDGGVYDKGLANYTTSVALVAFHEANQSGKYDTVIKNATRFLKSLQYDDSVVEEKDPKFGGVGYDKTKRPDLSNTQMFLDALQAAGV